MEDQINLNLMDTVLILIYRSRELFISDLIFHKRFTVPSFLLFILMFSY